MGNSIMLWEKLHGLRDEVRALHQKVDTMLVALQQIKEGNISMSQQLTDLSTKVHAMTDVTNGAVTLIQGLAAQIAALKDDPAALQALSDELTADAANLSAAVTANTTS